MYTQMNGLLVVFRLIQPSPPTQLRTDFLSQKKPRACQQSLSSPPWKPCTCTCTYAYCGHLIYTVIQQVGFCVWLPSLMMCFLGASVLTPVLELRSFSGLSDTPSYQSATFNLSVQEGWIYLLCFYLLGYSVSSAQ